MTETQRTRVRRNAARGHYDIEQIRAVLDSNQICHVAFITDGEPRIIPTLYMRRDDYLYLHGNRQAALLRHLAAGGFACVSVMTLDGVVVARSGFHCSMNYRSAVVFGRGEQIPPEEHEAVLEALLQRSYPVTRRPCGVPRRRSLPLLSWSAYRSMKHPPRSAADRRSTIKATFRLMSGRG